MEVVVKHHVGRGGCMLPPAGDRQGSRTGHGENVQQMPHQTHSFHEMAILYDRVDRTVPANSEMATVRITEGLFDASEHFQRCDPKGQDWL